MYLRQTLLNPQKVLGICVGTQIIPLPRGLVNLDKDESATRKVLEWNRGSLLAPTVVVSGNGRTRRLAQPSNEELDAIISELAA